ncbi:MAG: general secretion pathway protein GspK [Candidatus Omnitrophica bacterium]|nr:general secretion pathway protein GspK [Candidatus Omnitrophota bacterium]
MNRRRGSLLVMTLWIVTILGALSVAVARYLSTEVRLTRYRLVRHEARELARSGVSLAQRLIQEDTDDPQVDWSEETWAQPLTVSPASGRQLTVVITDEERKLNVNAASAEQLEPLLGSRQLAEAIVDYADTGTDGPAESPVDTPPYYPKNASVVALEELRDLPDMTDEIFTALQQWTFAAGAPTTLTVNINTATRDVLQAAGLPTLADAIVAFREQGHYFASLTPDVVTENAAVPPPFDPANTEFQNARSRLVVASQFFLVRATGSTTLPSVQHHVEAVIQRSTDSSPPRIIAWREL